jgi:tight adherence protein C
MPPTWVFALLSAAGALTVFWAVRPALFPTLRPTVVDARIQYYGTDVNFTDDVARLSFWDRMVQPTIDSLSQALTQLTPLDYVTRLEHRLEQAGRPSGLRAAGFIVLRSAAVLVAAAFAFTLGLFIGNPILGLVGAIVLGGIAWIGMAMWLSGRIQARRNQIERALPNLIDFLVISVTAGLTLDRALTRVVAQYDNALTRGLSVALAEVQLGRPRLEALDAYGRSTGVNSVHAFIQALVSSERMGVPTADVLRVQAETARWRRSDKAAQLGGSAAIKMTLPMVLFIFPTIWLVLLGPAIFVILKKGI